MVPKQSQIIGQGIIIRVYVYAIGGSKLKGLRQAREI